MVKAASASVGKSVSKCLSCQGKGKEEIYVARSTAAATRIYRLLANAPRWFYRLGLGWVLGKRVVQVTHRGRKSRLLRRTILEVLSYDPQTREVLVVSGWERKTDWYRNIQREPALEVRIGRMHYRPVQEFLSPQETAQLILTLFRKHPREVRFVGPLLGIDPDAEDAALLARLEAFFRGVRFHPAA